jgi:hypothetical protein
MAESALSQKQRLLLTLCIVLAVALNWLPALDKQAQVYLSATIENNAIVFGVVRTLNGVISVVQSAEVGIGVAGVSVGEILDPINDLIERFSGLLLITLTALAGFIADHHQPDVKNIIQRCCFAHCTVAVAQANANILVSANLPVLFYWPVFTVAGSRPCLAV